MAKRTVLIAENDGIILLDLKTMLKSNNYKPVIVKSTEELLDHYKSQKPDVIIADLFLNKSSSEDVLLEIDKIDSTPIILISGSPKSQLENISKKMSHCTFLSKPFDKSELLDLIRKSLGD